MANTKSAKKMVRVAKKNKIYNTSRSDKVKDSVKAVVSAISFDTKELSFKAVSGAQKQIDKALKNGRLTKNKANRLKSKLVKVAKKKLKV